MRILVWLFRAFLFFSLFAFALNNQQVVTLNWFFGYAWSARLVIIVLVTFAAGVVVGVLAMAPSWWRQRRKALRGLRPQAAPASSTTPSAVSLPEAPAHPIDGL